MKLSKKLFLTIFFNLISLALLAQYEGIQKGYYKFPIKPDQTNYLSGTMGELRPGHFHAGLDIKTDGKTGLNVYAAADGYVSRIRIGPGGYGNCLYINHPNGTTTVYAHLEKFSDEVAQYVLENHYKRKTHAMNLFPKKGMFNFKKGDVIAFSGNTGSSTGPHLHFEIRSIDQEVLDPLRIGFNEVLDDVVPVPASIGVKTMDMTSRVNGQFGYETFQTFKAGNGKFVTDTINVSGTIGLELYSFDRQTGTNNRNGVPFTSLFVNNQLYFTQDIDSINFSSQKEINVHSNYELLRATKTRFGKLYIDDGNALDFYDTRAGNGLLQVKEGDTLNVSIELEDANQNKSTLDFVILGRSDPAMNSPIVTAKQDYFILDNTLIVHQSTEDQQEKITVYEKEGSSVIEPDYTLNNEHFYLVDLKRFLPVRIDFGNGKVKEYNFAERIPAASNQAFLSDTYSLRFDRNSLFDTLYIQAKHEWSESEDILEVGQPTFPLKGRVKVEWQPKAQYDSLENYQVYKVNNPRYPSFVGGEYKDGKFAFSFSSFGKFTLLKDDTQPKVKLISTKNNRVSFRIKDDLSGIRSFEAKINGEWLLMHYEPKSRLIWSERLDKNKPLEGAFELVVADNAGNESKYELKLGEL